MGKLLDRALSNRNMALAWEQVSANRGAPGPDAISLKRWERKWEENLVKLRQAALTGTYKPRRPRYVSVPKKGGGFRRLAILTVNDRVLQRAVLNVLDDLFEPMFLPCSFGYRVGRSAKGAVEQVLAARDAGRRWVLDADIDECFDSIDHELLMGFVMERIGAGEPILTRLLDGWLRAGRSDPRLARGICQGSVLSPLLCNVYLHRLDEALCANPSSTSEPPPSPNPSASLKASFGRGKGQGEGEGLPHWTHIRYADDFVVLCSTQAEAQQALRCARKTLAGLKLQLERRKTSITHFDAGFVFLGVHFERDEYSYTWRDKRIAVEGEFTGFLYDFGPAGYESWNRG